MQEVQFEIDAQRVGRASGYLGGLTVERYTFTGATIPPGTRLAILTRAGVTIAAAEIIEGNAATVDTNTQEVADLLRYQPLGACESVYISLGNADTIIAIIPAVMRKNWLDDEATHPPVPANRYPTKTELDEWLARFDERAAAAETANADAQEAAEQSAQRATAAQTAKTAAESAATAAQTAQGKAEAAQAAAKTAQEGAEAAQAAAESSATEAAQSAQEAAENVATLLQGKVDAAEAAKAGAEAAKTSAETAKAGADAAKTAAASSATSAANSAAAAAKSATDLADAVATAESLDGRIGALEAGTGAYIIQSRDVITNGKPTSADVGKVLYFDHFANETTSTLAVTNRTPWAQKVCPAPIVANNPDVCAVGCFDYTKNKKYVVFMGAISNAPIGYLYELTLYSYKMADITFKSKLAPSLSTGGKGAHFWSHNICVHDGFVFYVSRGTYNGLGLAVCEVETGKIITTINLDPKNTGGTAVNSAIWYNPLSGHICVIANAFSLPTGETWGGFAYWKESAHLIRVFSWDSETKTLSDIPDGDIPATIIDVSDAVAEGIGGTYWQGYGSTWPIRDQVFLSLRGINYMALFHATADDRIEPCYEWDVEYETGNDGITRPVWETQPEEWTDADGNTKTIQNYVRNCTYDSAIVPKMRKGRVLKFMCTAGYDGVPSGTWSANPVFVQSVYAFYYSGECNRRAPIANYTSMPVLTDGVFRWTPVAGYKFVRQEAFNTWEHLQDYTKHPRDEATGLYLLKDIRKGTARKLTGWLPKSGQYLLSVGAQTGYDATGGGFTDTIKTSCVVALTAAQSGTPLSRIGAVYNAGTDGATMTPLPLTATYGSDWWIASMLPYCPFGFFGNVWMTTYKQTIGGVL